MEDRTLVRRELYVDVTGSGTEPEEIYLYRVDFLRGESFRSREYVFCRPEQEDAPPEDAGERTEERRRETSPAGPEFAEPDEKEIAEQFFDVWTKLLREPVPTERYATDARAAMTMLFLPLSRRHPWETLLPEAPEGREALHDCISMGRVLPILAMDEKQHLSAGIRRRIRERYHQMSDLVKQESGQHIVLCRRPLPEGGAELSCAVTDREMQPLAQELRFAGGSPEAAAARLNEVLVAYPDADVLVERAEPALYGIVSDIARFMKTRPVPMLYSLGSMLTALGKDGKRILEEETRKAGGKAGASVWAAVYRDYLRHAEEIRFRRFADDRVYSTHTFYLPLRIPSEAAWKRQFEKNTMWQRSEGEREAYHIGMTGEIKGKYTVKAEDEQFLLRITDISIARYFRDYAVIRLETENRCYPGAVDRENINALASSLRFERPGTPLSDTKRLPSGMDVKLKAQGQVYAVSAFPAAEPDGGLQEPWLSGLFLLGHKKEKPKKPLHMGTQLNRILCVEQGAQEEERFLKESLELALVRTELFGELERELAKAAAPKEEKKELGRLTGKQKRKIRRLYAQYRCMAAAYGPELEEGAARDSFRYVDGQLGTQEIEQRLERKFAMYRDR